MRYSNAFADPKYLGPVKGMFAEVPTLDIMFVDATTSNVMFPSIAKLLQWDWATYTLMSTDDKGYGRMDISVWDIPLVAH